MIAHTNFVGIYIGEFEFFVNVYLDKKVNCYENTQEGIAQFLQNYQAQLLKQGLCVLEATGGYEMDLLTALCDQAHAVHRADGYQVKNFIRSYRKQAKTDKSDAKALALYGYERHALLGCYHPASDKQSILRELATRRRELTKLLVAEKNRLKAPKTGVTKVSCQTLIRTIESELQQIESEMERIINQDETLKAEQEVLKSIPGIGEKISKDLLVLLPELGRLDRRKIAAMAGLAPRANDSGKRLGYRSTGHGRAGVKPLLFMAALAASKSHSPLKGFYEELVAKGKPKKVALTALARKILVIANARVKEIVAQQISENNHLA